MRCQSKRAAHGYMTRPAPRVVDSTPYIAGGTSSDDCGRSLIRNRDPALLNPEEALNIDTCNRAFEVSEDMDR